jgi:hypothetical protein
MPSTSPAGGHKQSVAVHDAVVGQPHGETSSVVIDPRCGDARDDGDPLATEDISEQSAHFGLLWWQEP